MMFSLKLKWAAEDSKSHRHFKLMAASGVRSDVYQYISTACNPDSRFASASSSFKYPL